MSRVKNEIHCRVDPEIMQYIINQAVVKSCTISDVCRELLTRGMRSNEELKPLKAALLSQLNPSLKLLKLLHNQLEGFEYQWESNCTGEEGRFSWSFGLDASDEYFESAEDCLRSFLKYMSDLKFSYKTLPTIEHIEWVIPIVTTREPDDVFVSRQCVSVMKFMPYENIEDVSLDMREWVERCAECGFADAWQLPLIRHGDWTEVVVSRYPERLLENAIALRDRFKTLSVFGYASAQNIPDSGVEISDDDDNDDDDDLVEWR